MTTTPPGWYDDGHGALRWWDGTQWTEHVAQPDAETSPAPSEAEIVAARLGFDGQGAASDAAVEASAQPAPVGAWGETPAQADGTVQPVQPLHPAATPYPAPEGYAPAGGYPQGVYPGTPTGVAPAGGGFAAATAPRRKSKLWILWVVLGVVLLGIVIAAAVVIPLLFLSATSSSSQGQTDDERAAAAAVARYDDAWQDGDCDAFASTTTEDFRTASGFTDCAAFEDDADRFDENFDDYEVTVTGVETVGDEIEVTTNETYTALVDENGEAADPAPGATVYYYTLVEADGAWVIDDLTYE